MIILRILTLLTLLAGLFVSQVYVIGFDLHRFFAPSWIFLGLAGILVFLPIGRGERGAMVLKIALLLLSVYIAGRGMLSDVPILACKEYPVLFYGILVFLAAAHLAKYRAFLYAIIGYSIVILVIQQYYNLVPIVETASFPKPWGWMWETQRMYGFFMHYNPFSSYCGLCAGVLLSLVHLRLSSKVLSIALKLLVVVLGGWAVYGAYMSGSRMGTAVTFISALVGLFGGVVARLLFQDGKLASLNRIFLMLGVAVVGVGVTFGGFSMAFKKVSEKRGMTGDVGRDVMGGMRIASIGMGFSMWMREPIVGNGPRSYHYYAPSLRETGSAYDHGNMAHPDSEMVHNDYMQTLAEYGVIGFILTLGVVGIIMWLIWQAAWARRRSDTNWFVAPLAMTAALSGIMLHSLGDFTGHLLPVFLQLTLILGAAYGWVNRESRIEVTRERDVKSTVLSTLLILASAGCFLSIGGKQVLHAKSLLDYDRIKWTGSESDYITKAREIRQQAPDPFILERLGLKILHNSASVQGEARQEMMLEAEQVLTHAYELHPYRMEIVSNLARTKLELGKIDEAEELIEEAFQWSGDRWVIYRVGELAESYLIKRGEQAWQSRQAGKALAYFLKAREYNESGYWNRKSEVRKSLRVKIDQNISILESGKVKPDAGLSFFKRYGL